MHTHDSSSRRQTKLAQSRVLCRELTTSPCLGFPLGLSYMLLLEIFNFFFFSKFRGKEFFQSSKMLAQTHRWGEGGLGQEELRSRCGMGIWGGQQKTPRTGCRPFPALLTSPTPPGSGTSVGPYLGLSYPLTTPILLGLPSVQHNMQAQNSAARVEVGRIEDSDGCSSLEVGEIHHLSLSFPLG